LFSKGDLQGMRSRLLHSSAWQQHGRTSFGNEQITSSWMVWLANCGLSDCSEAISLDNGNESIVLLTLSPKSSPTSVRIAVWSWHNREFIKRLVCIPDTELLAGSLGVSATAVADLLPQPDPLLISDYDQQQHPFSVDVTPGDLADIPAGMQAAIDGWWSLWRDEQLAAVSECYSNDAHIQLPGRVEAQTGDQLIRFASHTFQQMQRRYCQPESVLLDPDNPGRLGILWHMEGDMNAGNEKAGQPRQRVRNTLITYLEIQDGKIVRDTSIFDQAALIKRLSA
jgi:hypothetical protein